MQTNQNNTGSIKYSFKNDQIEFKDTNDESKKVEIDCSTVPSGNTIVLQMPSQSGQLSIGGGGGGGGVWTNFNAQIGNPYGQYFNVFENGSAYFSLGNFIFISIHVKWNSKNGITGPFVLQLPFTAANQSGADRWPFQLGGYQSGLIFSPGTSGFGAEVDAGEHHISLWQFVSGQAPIIMTCQDNLGDYGEFQLSGWFARN